MIYDLFTKLAFFFFKDITLRSGNHEVDEQKRIGVNVSRPELKNLIFDSEVQVLSAILQAAIGVAWS